MNCYFCNTPCIKMKRLAVATGEDWVCDNHSLRVLHELNYTYHKKGDCDGPNCCPKKSFDIVSIRWHEPNKELFDIEWDLRDNRLNVIKLNHGTIISFKDIPPNLSPENIQEKVHLWLTYL